MGAQREVVDERLFKHLRQVRQELARRQGKPPYIVMTDTTLRQVAAVRPRTLEAFGGISGIGEYKMRKYGPHFIKAIDDFLK